MSELDINKFKKCTCGRAVNDPEVVATDNYSSWGWFWWTMGTTAIPKSISFYCNKCEKNFDEIIDKKLIKHFIYYKRH